MSDALWTMSGRCRTGGGPYVAPLLEQLHAEGARWEELAGALRRVELTATVEAHAGELAARHALSGFDAVHLASALVVAAASPLVLATWDRRLAAAASTLGLATLPA